MKTKTLLKSVLVAVLATCVSITADAQLKGILNKAKKAVEEKAEKVLDKALEKSSDEKSTESKTSNTSSSRAETAKPKSKSTSIPSGPEIPELMSIEPSSSQLDASDVYMDKLAWGLRKNPVESVKALAHKLNARAKWDTEMLTQMEEGSVERDSQLEAQLIKELKNWSYFLIKCGQIVNTAVTSVNWKKDEHGKFYYNDVYPIFSVGMWSAGVQVSQDDVKGFGSMVSRATESRKFRFCTEGSTAMNPIIVDDDHVRVAKLDYNMMRNIAWLFEGYPIEWWKEQCNGDYKQDLYEKYYYGALLFCEAISEALKLNTPGNLEFKSMPKAGGMNASMKAKALAAEKSKFKDVLDVVITSDSWNIEKTAAGVPIRRVIYGYSIGNTKDGKRATRVSWAEEYQGGGKYGSLHTYGVGGDSFYVK